MRRCAYLVFAVALIAAEPASGGQAPDATAVLAPARQALGGEARLNAVKTFIATGRTRQIRGQNLVPIEFEIQAELPDKYARRDEFPAQDSGPTTTGFNGDRLIQIPVQAAPSGRAGAPPVAPAQQQAIAAARLAGVKQDFARLTLGMFASSFSGFPLTFTYAGDAEAPQGKARVLNVAGPAGFKARLFIDEASHLPIMVSWQQAPAAGRGGGPAAGGQPSAPDHRLYFADYRAVDGLNLPFRLRHAVGNDTIEETTFDRFRINARIDPRRFDAGD